MQPCNQRHGRDLNVCFEYVLVDLVFFPPDGYVIVWSRPDRWAETRGCFGASCQTFAMLSRVITVRAETLKLLTLLGADIRGALENSSAAAFKEILSAGSCTLTFLCLIFKAIWEYPWHAVYADEHGKKFANFFSFLVLRRAAAPHSNLHRLVFPHHCGCYVL